MVRWSRRSRRAQKIDYLELESALNAALERMSDRFLHGGGRRRVSGMQWGPVARTVTPPGEPGQRIVQFARRADGREDWWQLRGQAFHEAFHAVWPELVYHWTHEMLAELVRFRGIVAVEPAAVPDGYAHPLEYAATSLVAAQGSSLPPEVFRRSAVPPGGEEFEAFYHCALTLGLALEAAVGEHELVRLARAVASAPCSADADPHECDGEPCHKDAAVLAWVGEQADPAAVSLVLGLGRSGGAFSDQH